MNQLSEDPVPVPLCTWPAVFSEGRLDLILQRERRFLCRVADAGHSDASTRANSRRRQLAKGRNRGRWSAEGAAGAMGI
jgi:hypothetical protein